MPFAGREQRRRQPPSTQHAAHPPFLARCARQVSQFYSDKAESLEAALSAKSGPDDGRGLHPEIQALIKYVALNYLAVVKAIKKRNRQLRAALGEQVRSAIGRRDGMGWKCRI